MAFGGWGRCDEMKPRTKKLLIGVLVLLIPLWVLGDPPIYFAEEIRGQVVDEQTGIPLAICQGRLGDTPLLAGLKTLNRLEQVLLKAELEARDALEGLVLDRAENIVEAVTANVFWRQDSVVYTPALSTCGVTGVMRGWILRQLQQWGIVCHQVQAGLAALKTADELFLSNALMEVVPVTGIEDVTYQDHSLARQLQTAFYQTAEAS